MQSWNEYKPGKGDDYIPIARWGQDHWSTLAYLETRVTDGRGLIDNPRMRCNPRLHRHFAHVCTFTGKPHDGPEYPTRLKDGEIDHHDDWSCLEDMVAAGLITAQWRVRHVGALFGNSEAKVALTDAGQALAAQLRAHKAGGGRWANFEPQPVQGQGANG